jgi:hypothetical protein
MKSLDLKLDVITTSEVSELHYWMNSVTKGGFMRLPVLALGLAVLPCIAWAGTVESQKDNVEVFSAPDKASPVLHKLKKGETINSGERKGMYWQVKTASGKDGFVSVLAVRVKTDEKVGLADAMREAVKKGRSQSAADGGRTRSSVMGVRGLDDTSEVGVAANLRPNLHAVYALEDFQVSEDKVKAQGELVFTEIESKLK